MKEIFILLITWAPTALFAIILIWQLIAGARRGLSKSIKLFITFILAIGVALGFYLAISKNFDTVIVNVSNETLHLINSVIKGSPESLTELFNNLFGNTYGPITDHTTFSGYIEQILSNTKYFEDASQGLTLAEATKLLYSMSMLVVHIVILIISILVYFIAKAILYIIYLIFFKEGRRKKRINKRHEEGKSDKPYKAKHGFGALVGLVRGLIVGLFVISIFGTVSILVPRNKDEEIKDDSNLLNNMHTNRDLYIAVSNWSDMGITGLLNNMKNKDNLPYYLIISNKMLSSEYTYEENGETKTITLSLNDDLVPLTKSMSKAAYVFLMYGYDTNKDYTNEEMVDFICSDKTIEGLTLQERIDSILKDTEFGGYTNYLVDGLVRTYVSNVCKNVSSTDSDEYKKLELTNKILYQLFIGENSIKTSDVIKGENLSAAFNTFVLVETHQDEINALSKVFDNSEDSTKLAFGINKSVSNNTEETANVFKLINNELKNLTFYSETRFQRVVSDIVIILLNEQYEDLDFTSVVTDDTLYDVNWTESLETVFDVLQDVTDLVIEKDFTTSDELTDYLMTELKNKESKTVSDLKSLINSSAGSIILNSKAFNSIVSDSLTKMFNEILPDSNIEIIETNYASYTNSNGVKVNGELEKIIDSLGSAISDIYSVSKDSSLTDNEKTDEMLSIISNDEAVRKLITDTLDYSYLVHSILSSVISNVSISDNNETLYIPSSSITSVSYLNQNIDVIDSSEFTNMLDFLSEFSNNYSISDFSNNDKYVDLVFDLATYVKNSNIIKANVAKAIYNFKDSASLSFTTSLDLSSENIDKNMSNWIKEDGEVDKLINVITYKNSEGNDQKELIKDIINDSSNYNTYIVTIINNIDTFGNVLFKSDVINATITSFLKKEDSVYLPSNSYQIAGETIKVDEIKSMCSFVKDALNVTSETTSIDFNSLDAISLSKYSDDLDGLLALFDSSIVTATLGYNIIKNSNNETSTLVVPSILMFDKSDETNLALWQGQNGEAKKIARGIYHLGLLSKVSGSDLSFNEDKLLELDNTLIDTVFESDIFNATGALYFEEHRPESLAVKSEYIISKDTIINDYLTTPLTHELEVKKLILAVKSLGISLSQSNIKVELINKMNDVDDNNKSSLDYIIDSDILYYGLSDYIIKSENLKVSKSSIDCINSYNYVESNELHKFVNGVIALDLSEELTEFDANKLLSSDVDKLLESNIVWYTLSDKLLGLDGIDILNNSVEIQNTDEVFVTQEEIKNFTTAIKCVTDDLDTIDVNINTLVENVNTLTESNIIRTSITQKVLESNDIVIDRVGGTRITYAEQLAKCNEEGITSMFMYTLTKEEIKNFVSAVNTICGTSPTYDVDYTSIQIKDVDESILDSSVVLLGIQSNIQTAITAYNAVSTTAFDDSAYDIYEYQVYHHDTKAFENKTLHTKECVQALKEAYNAL